MACLDAHLYEIEYIVLRVTALNFTCNTGCFLENAANRSSLIYCPILINKKKTVKWLKKHYKTA
jgi:hypothetical protein